MENTGEKPNRDYYGKSTAVGGLANGKNTLSEVKRSIPRGPSLQQLGWN